MRNNTRNRNDYRNMSTKSLDNRLANIETPKRNRKEILRVLKSRGIKKGDIVIPKNSEYNPIKGTNEIRYSEVTDVKGNDVYSIDYGSKIYKNQKRIRFWQHLFGKKYKSKQLKYDYNHKKRKKNELKITGRRIQSTKEKGEYKKKDP